MDNILNINDMRKFKFYNKGNIGNNMKVKGNNINGNKNKD
jgi:hypothetical protein